ncbi:MAG: hypothetical protein ACOX6T_03995 [Myxococcales bacterium]|jgi:hypothetical protein
MTRFKIALIAGSLFLGSCGAFTPPRVECANTEATIDVKETAELGFCNFPEAYSFVVTTAPRVPVEPAHERNGSADEYSLAYARIKIKRATDAVYLCEGTGCAPNLAEIETTLDENGALTYKILLMAEPAGLLPGPGGQVTSEGVIAIEEYGPGNVCPVLLKANLTCEKPTEQ